MLSDKIKKIAEEVVQEELERQHFPFGEKLDDDIEDLRLPRPKRLLNDKIEIGIMTGYHKANVFLWADKIGVGVDFPYDDSPTAEQIKEQQDKYIKATETWLKEINAV